MDKLKRLVDLSGVSGRAQPAPRSEAVALTTESSTGPSPCLVEIDRVRGNPRSFPTSKAQQRSEDLAG
ncbi:MAG: hypothetical protein ACXVHB_32770, partial [Solirubrobacteraceae bacterium]